MAFNTDDLNKALQTKDIIWLKLAPVRTMRVDHSFRSNELEELLKIFHKNVPEIFEDEVELDYEERLPKSQWDERYFIKLTYWFEKNFAESRIPYIKEVGRTVFGK